MFGEPRDPNSSSERPPETAFSFIVPALISLVVVGGLGALNLNYPFVHDQTVSLYAAKSIANGGTLYVDFWDNKMPGLVWFYFLAGTIFGFNERGVHSLELIWMLAFSVTLMLTSRHRLQPAWTAVFLPLAIVGTYYVAVDPFQLTQLEIIVAFPIFLALHFTSRIEDGTQHLERYYFGAGLCAGITVVFKLVFAPIFALFWLVALAYAAFVKRLPLSYLLLNMLLPATLGVVVVLSGVVIFFWSAGALDELLWTAFIYPPAALKIAPTAPLIRLFESSLFFSGFFTSWALFVVIALADWWYLKRDLFTGLVMVWLVAAAGIILVQRFSWWPYHFLILFAPLGILGVRGAVALPARLLLRKQITSAQAAILSLALLFAPSAGLAVPAVQKISAHIEVFIHQKGTAADLKEFANGKYTVAKNSVRFLAAETARPGNIYVFGNPLYYLLSGRDPALPIIGWPWRYFLDSQWNRVASQLEQAKPPYIYVDRDNYGQMEVRGGGVLEFLLSNYVPFTSDGTGTWYQIDPRKLDQ